jgi:hypothetical protein
VSPDYGVQSPERPEGGRGAWANIRYTTTTAVVIARGHKVTRSDPQQYCDLARQVVNDDEFSGSLLVGAIRTHGPSDQGRFTKELGVLSTRSFEIDGRLGLVSALVR